MIIPIIVLFIVFVLITFRQIGNAKLQMFQLTRMKISVGRAAKMEIWHIMLFGALVVLLTGQISPVAAAESINIDVMLFLFGMFVVGCALEESGYLSHLSYKLFSKAKSTDHLLLLILFGIGIASAFLMNDTLAIIGTPVVLLLAASHGMSSKPLLIALAFAVTIGSVMSPIGNPQNLLIATSGNIQNPFVTFFSFLLLPTLITLFLAYLMIKFFYKEHFHDNVLSHHKEAIRDERLAKLSKISLILIAVLIIAKISAVFFGLAIDFRLTYIALIGALPIILLSRRRLSIIRNIDWHTLVFFASMFVLMESVWQAGFFQAMLNGYNITSIGMILVISVVLSQFISNVPLVALYLPVLVHTGASAKGLVALAAGSTIAGNLFILGAASNVIIIQNAEKRGETITFMEFAKVGIPLTIASVLVYWLFLVVM